ncbi:Carbohydrate-selective porin, OprB family [Persephonella hydrogeniphila]|uniref:Carbohydrate-selective porin, OprB family n=1 Tax=Persephonella hydrogeniphila TaxID=198703 RepID=A0A285NAD7_9AQUI|nr:carbohydrate porin [Persephonella hydrogeniphila]SNZ06400.1 Carbohydrate-selective porin, OprB family [Persephonella hydrogeniphila]
MLDLIAVLSVAVALFFVIKSLRKRKNGKCDKCTSALLSFLILSSVQAQEVQKPFILEHKLHKHRVDFVNSTVYQQIKEYGTVYNTSHIFLTVDFSETDEIFINGSVSFGNGLKKKLQQREYSISTTADDLEEYLKDINGTGRKYLLEMFYQKKIKNLLIIGGLIDAASFTDANRYANDEHTQFLNDMFVNNPIASIPSYNFGSYIRYNLDGKIGLSGVYIQNKPDKGNTGILEIEFETENFSVRPYYFYVFGGEEFKGFGISADYAFNENFGIFFRGGNSNRDYNYFVSAGFEKKRIITQDKIGVGIGQMKGKSGVKDISACECYYTVAVDKHLSISGDIQYIKEKKEDIVFGGRIFFSY